MNQYLIINQTCKFLNINPANIHKRNNASIQAKHIAIYIIRKQTNLKLKDITKTFNLSHSELIRATKQTEAQHIDIANQIIEIL